MPFDARRHAVAELGRDDHVVTSPGNDAADQLLVVPTWAVAVGGVDEARADIDRV